MTQVTITIDEPTTTTTLRGRSSGSSSLTLDCLRRTAARAEDTLRALYPDIERPAEQAAALTALGLPAQGEPAPVPARAAADFPPSDLDLNDREGAILHTARNQVDEYGNRLSLDYHGGLIWSIRATRRTYFGLTALVNLADTILDQAGEPRFASEPKEPGYTVELGDHRFTQAQWEAIDAHVQGRIAAARPDIGPVTMHPSGHMTCDGRTGSKRVNAAEWRAMAEEGSRLAEVQRRFADHLDAQQQKRED